MRAAARRIQPLGERFAASALYETAAVGPPQPHYLNAAVRIRTSLDPAALLARLLEVEASLGRQRRERWGPRTIDLDVLWADGEVRSEPGLELPHPRLVERAFALVPLVEVAPEAADPRTGKRYADLAADIDQSGIRLLPATIGSGWLG